MVFSVQSWQRVTATQGGSQHTVRNHARILLKTLGFLMFSDGPQPGNSVSLEMFLAPRAESYSLLKTLGRRWDSSHFHLELRMAD